MKHLGNYEFNNSLIASNVCDLYQRISNNTFFYFNACNSDTLDRLY